MIKNSVEVLLEKSNRKYIKVRNSRPSIVPEYLALVIGVITFIYAYNVSDNVRELPIVLLFIHISLTMAVSISIAVIMVKLIWLLVMPIETIITKNDVYVRYLLKKEYIKVDKLEFRGGVNRIGILSFKDNLTLKIYDYKSNVEYLLIKDSDNNIKDKIKSL